MNDQDTFKIENILFDIHLGIKELVKILFIDNEQLKKYMKILENKGYINKTHSNIHFEKANHLVIFGKNNNVLGKSRQNITFVASSVEGYDDYIQIGENKFIRP